MYARRVGHPPWGRRRLLRPARRLWDQAEPSLRQRPKAAASQPSALSTDLTAATLAAGAPDLEGMTGATSHGYCMQCAARLQNVLTVVRAASRPLSSPRHLPPCGDLRDRPSQEIEGSRCKGLQVVQSVEPEESNEASPRESEARRASVSRGPAEAPQRPCRGPAEALPRGLRPALLAGALRPVRDVSQRLELQSHLGLAASPPCYPPPCHTRLRVYARIRAARDWNFGDSSRAIQLGSLNLLRCSGCLSVWLALISQLRGRALPYLGAHLGVRPGGRTATRIRAGAKIHRVG